MIEVDLAARVVTWLEKKGWDVYQEVDAVGGVADIVATNAGTVWIIETKINFTFALIDQARDRQECADLVSVAVPQAKCRAETAYWVLRQFGIGLITVPRSESAPVSESRGFKPRQTNALRHQVERLRARLEPEHKTYARAGEKHAKRWTPFKRTCREVVRYVTKNGPSTLKEIVNGVEHHYSSDTTARAHIVAVIDRDLIPELKVDRDCRPMKVRLYAQH